MTTTKDYDNLNRLSSISSALSAAPAQSYAYLHNDANQRTRMTLADGSYWDHEYDSLGQLKSGKRRWSDTTPVAGQQFEYAFDDIGNRTSTKAGGDSAGGSLRTATYGPNTLNQYTNRTVTNIVDILGMAYYAATVTVNSQSTYRRNEYFHRAYETASNSSSPVYQPITNTATYGSWSSNVVGNIYLPQTPENYAYDLDGNLSSDGRWTYTWDCENRVTSMTALSGVPDAAKRKLEFEYDWRGRRISKKVHIWNGSAYVLQTTLKFAYDGWNLMAELDGSNTLIRSYLWGLDLSGSLQGAGGVGGLVGMRPAGSSLHFAAYDGNGNVMALVDASHGTISAQYEYGPFGAPIRVTGTMGKANPFQWSTHYTDDETDLVYYGYRYHNPSTGCFLNRDPLEERGGPNLYAFVRNNPITFFDPSGLHVYTVDVTAKSWIVEPITPGRVTGMNPLNLPNLLFAVGQVELLTSDNVIDDAIDGRYRFLSQKTISVDGCGSKIKSFNFSPLFTDAGLEGGVFIPAVTVVEDRGYQATLSSLRFTWMVKGRPHPAAEPAVFWPVRFRTSVYIEPVPTGRFFKS